MFSPSKLICFLPMFISTSINAMPIDSTRLATVVKQEEQTLNARIGVAVIDTASDKIVSYRGNERFPLNSTFKALLCGVLLSEVDKGKVALTDAIQFNKTELVEYSPVSEKFVAPASMNWQQLCSAAVSYSDNTAANLIAKKVGGPAAMNLFFSGLGDSVTHLDRYEPELNSAIPGDERDTTTPVAVSQTLQKLTLGEVLKPSSRQQLVEWMRDDKVADALLRSVLPAGWKIADKTGAGDYGSRSIISIVWPKNSSPLIVAIYITQTEATIVQSNEAIARIGKILFLPAQ
ncbi:class A beta-lactamase [Photorhabdus luminescens]|uniref:Beta-lactamase n=1 Tax=Photorhabdus luminescens subsp. sonorensis TaxID=1173677 RepID=A0A5C4RDH2_PHOLU|nr:class A beta-lactamase [Photorhabdus luminescens]TNH41791.1 class A beta-lactamase [Photorhabdus luminescens subsp. sonorensis]